MSEVDLPLMQGSDWAVMFRYKSRALDGTTTPIDITGMRVTVAISKGASVSPPLLSFDTDNSDPEISIDGAAGEVSIVVPSATTLTLPLGGRKQHWRYEAKLHLTATRAITLGIGDVPATPLVPTA